MKNGVNSIKTTQQLIVHMFKTKKTNQSSKNSITNKIQSKNNNLAINFKHSLLSQNLNTTRKSGLISNLSNISNIHNSNNLTNRTKYKTAKNSPEQILIQKNLSRQKHLIGSNPNNNNISNQINKQNIKLPVSNSINKIIFQNQKHNTTVKDEIIKKRIMQIKQKKNMTTMNSTNNSISLSNNNYNYNFNHKHNNSNININISYLQNKDININKIKKQNIKLGQKQPNSYREKRRINSKYDIDNINYNLKFINNNNSNNNNNNQKNFSKEKKYYNLINKYISSSSISFKQPMRPQKKSLKNKYNTINAKRAIDIYKQSIQNKQGINLNKNNTQKNKNVNINNITNINNMNNFGNINKNNYIFSSTSNNLYKPKQQNKKIPNFHFNMKIINKTSYQSKQNSRKHSAEKSVQNSMNNSSINYIINSSSSNYFIKNYNSPAITVNNHRKSDIYYKKIDYLNNGNNKNNIGYNYSNNKKNNMGNGMLNNKYRFSGVYSCSNSKEHSKDNNYKKSIIMNIKDFKRYNVDKIISQLYKYKYNNNSNSQNNDSKNIKNKNNNFVNIKEEVEQENNYNKIKNNKNNSNLSSKKEIKEKKDLTNINESNNPHHSKKLSDNMNISIINKIIINGDNYNLLYKNKEISPVIIKKNKNKINEEENNINNINNIDNKKDIKPIKEKKENNYEKINDIMNEESLILKSKNKSKENEKEKEKTNKKERDKDLSCSENDNDDLLLYVNNNIDYIPNTINTELTESNDSITSSLKENGKFTCYNRDMEIISNYIKNYYKKNNKYPTTKIKFYKYGRLLGKGAFGKVNLCLHVLTGRLVAIKSINKEKIINDRQKQKIRLETKIMKRLSKSNNIVKIFETYETKKHICIVMEYICAGDLLNYIKKRNKLQEPVAKFIFKQIILALKFIHENNIVHRDIKLDNILIDLDNNIKICDFGVSKIINKGDIMLEQCGTPAYIAPEILLNKGYEGFGVDVWSAGVVLYAMLSGTVPFKGNDIKELHNLITTGNYPKIKDISKEASHLISSIFEVDPTKRITTEDILNHPWLIDVDLNFWKNKNLFTNAEYVLLAKSNVDYRNIENKEDMIENFDIRNIDTVDENINKNIRTKSIILAPFNTSISNKENNSDSMSIEYITDFNNPDLKILNGVIKYMSKVKDLNRNYELNNNQEIDNGVVILPNDSDEKNKKENDIITPFNKSINSKRISKYISPQNEIDDNYKNKEKNIDKDEINIDALEILENLGYDKNFMKESINKNKFNYATASYRLIVKYCFS